LTVFGPAKEWYGLLAKESHISGQEIGNPLDFILGV